MTEEERRQGRVAGILLDDEGRVDPDAYATDLSAEIRRCFCSCPPCSLLAVPTVAVLAVAVAVAAAVWAAVTDAHPDATAISFFGRCSVVAKAAVSPDWTNLYLAATKHFAQYSHSRCHFFKKKHPPCRPVRPPSPPLAGSLPPWRPPPRGGRRQPRQKAMGGAGEGSGARSGGKGNSIFVVPQP